MFSLSLLSLIYSYANGFHHSSPVTNFSRIPSKKPLSRRLFASREIASFDAEDFAMPSGSWPYEAKDFNRLDNTDDAIFYAEPRFVTHVDDRAIESLTSYYRDEFKAKSCDSLDVLDLCSSWISHFPKDIPLSRVVGVGMVSKELKANEALTEYYCQDLNKNPELDQFEDESFDIVCNAVSVDYLTDPLKVFQETFRVLKADGIALISFSNRMFATKAIAMWLQADDIDRLSIVASYFHYSAKWKSITALDVGLPPLEMPDRPTVKEIFSNPTSAFSWATTAGAVSRANNGDPMFVVKAIK